jgi:hypothetical protein
MTKNRLILTALVAVAVLAGVPAMAADEPGSAFSGPAPEGETVVGQPEGYGTASLSAFPIGAINFTPRVSTTAFTAGAGAERFITTAGGAMDAAPALPNGSQIERIELRACDTDAVNQVVVNFGPCPTGGSTCTLAGSVATGGAATPGCNNFSFTLPAPVIVNNQTTPILVEVNTGTTATTTWSAVKLYYRLRISPAPGVATFPTDVPTSHPFFRFVEALAAAGITGGCGAGTFCPDDAVTRGQMAVFLATALGLHFPN